mmetsp:Transcript_20333/g.56666  ORF Transcript_20333/g.56666 Transcript_20333/m.56666 type:complete len:218 (-) Transcript_20333:6-659(-)
MAEGQQCIVALHNDLAALIWPHTAVQRVGGRVLVAQCSGNVRAQARPCAPSHALKQQEPLQHIACLHLSPDEIQGRFSHRGSIAMVPIGPIVAGATVHAEGALGRVAPPFAGHTSCVLHSIHHLWLHVNQHSPGRMADNSPMARTARGRRPLGGSMVTDRPEPLLQSRPAIVLGAELRSHALEEAASQLLPALTQLHSDHTNELTCLKRITSFLSAI